jgi:putative oxidoreductase
MQKLFGWFGGYGVKGTGAFFETIGFRPGWIFAIAAGLSELVGGLFVVTGMLGPVGPGLIIAVMVVAILVVHAPNGFFSQANGYELPFIYAVLALVLAVAGPGAYSLDKLLGFPDLSQPTVSWTISGLAIVAGLANVVLRRGADAPVATTAR